MLYYNYNLWPRTKLYSVVASGLFWKLACEVNSLQLIIPQHRHIALPAFWTFTVPDVSWLTTRPVEFDFHFPFTDFSGLTRRPLARQKQTLESCGWQFWADPLPRCPRLNYQLPPVTCNTLSFKRNLPLTSAAEAPLLLLLLVRLAGSREKTPARPTKPKQLESDQRDHCSRIQL